MQGGQNIIHLISSHGTFSKKFGASHKIVLNVLETKEYEIYFYNMHGWPAQAEISKPFSDQTTENLKIFL